MKRTIPITTLFLDIGGALLTNGWDHHAFDTYEEGNLTREEYPGRVVCYQNEHLPGLSFGASVCRVLGFD